MSADVLWGRSAVGDRVMQVDDEPGVVLLTDGIPNWVRLPDLEPLGKDRDRVLRVQRHVTVRCSCDVGHTVTRLYLEDPTLVIDMCPATGWRVGRIKSNDE